MTKYNQDRSARIIKRHGLWQAQRIGTGKGTKTFDPWFDVGPAKDSMAAAAAVVGVTL